MSVGMYYTTNTHTHTKHTCTKKNTHVCNTFLHCTLRRESRRGRVSGHIREIQELNMAEQNPNDWFFTEITKLIEEMKEIKKNMEKDSKYQKDKLTKPQENEDSQYDQLPRLPPAQVMKLVQKDTKQQTWKVKEQIHKIHEHLKIQLGLVQKIEQLRQDLIPLERKQGEGLKNLHKKAKKLKTQAERIQDKCRKVHDKFEKVVEIEEKAEDIKLDDVQDITPLKEGAGPEEMRQMINKQGKVIKAQLLAQEIQHKIQHIQHEVTEVEQKAHRILWDEYYMKLACLAALRSKDPSTPVS